MENNNNHHYDFLIEIGTEELPAKGLEKLSKDFEAYLLDALKKLNIPHGESTLYATPRRLAVWIKNVADKQLDAIVERKGPATTAPIKAQEGFAKSCSVNLDQLTVQDNYLLHRHEQLGKNLSEFMPPIIEEALKKIPVGKTMRWGSHTESFIRPIRWLLMMHGTNIVPATIFGMPAGNITYGHRFHHPEPITINNLSGYEEILDDHKVIASFDKRREIIYADAQNKSYDLFQENPFLVPEITGLVEWPVVLECKFDERFLDVPQEALIAAMETHQKCLPIKKSGKLQARFLTVSNIDSKNPDTVIQGNERVMRARLADAEFFYATDCKQTLESRLDDLKTVTFQAKLGSLYEKSERISKLAKVIASEVGANIKDAERAGLLCKADLTSSMVGEFPELQGIMGGYYAEHDKEDKSIAEALREHYLPLPTSSLGGLVSLADRLDTLVGIFGINQQPTGDKDPFGLRRAAVGIINILIGNTWNLDLNDLLQKSVENYGDKLPNQQVIPEILKFILERMRAIYTGEGTNNTIILAVEARGFSRPVDFAKRIEAVEAFSQLPQAASLAAANKRVSNILLKEGQGSSIEGHPDPARFEQPAEHALWKVITDADKRCDKKEYAEKLQILAELQTPVDQFFNDVMVMVDNDALRINRLRLLNHLRQLFLQVADISLL